VRALSALRVASDLALSEEPLPRRQQRDERHQDRAIEKARPRAQKISLMNEAGEVSRYRLQPFARNGEDARLLPVPEPDPLLAENWLSAGASIEAPACEPVTSGFSAIPVAEIASQLLSAGSALQGRSLPGASSLHPYWATCAPCPTKSWPRRRRRAWIRRGCIASRGVCRRSEAGIQHLGVW
jgi:hypothetical protein